MGTVLGDSSESISPLAEGRSLSCGPAAATTLAVNPILLWQQACNSLADLVNWHQQHHAHLQPQLQPHWDVLAALSHKLQQRLVQVAVLGLVSRGKSALLNALYGERVFTTGPLHGVTQWPRSIRWQFPVEASAEHPLQIELIDTPGLDEIAGESRTQVAKAIALEADLILFVCTAELTLIETATLLELLEHRKPLLLVCNKADLYPNLTAEAFHRCLDPRLQQVLSVQNIVLTAAAPAPIETRQVWSDGRTQNQWQIPAPQIDRLQQKLIQVLNREGHVLIAINALRQAETAEATIVVELRQEYAATAQETAWKLIRSKALIVALNPIAPLDLLAGTLTDLLLIRHLCRLYGLTLNRHAASKLWKTLLSSAGALFLSQLGGGLMLDLADPTMGLAGELPAWAGTILFQGGMAAYGGYAISQSAQISLLEGRCWGRLGVSTLLQELLQMLEPEMLIYQLRQNVPGQS